MKNRLLSIFLCIAVIVSSIPVLTIFNIFAVTPNTLPVERINGGSFDSGTVDSQWTTDGESISVENFWASYPGNSKCLKIVTGNKKATTKATFDVVKSARYSVTFYSTGNIKYSVVGEDGGIIYNEASVSGNQKKTAFFFTAPANIDKVSLVFTAENTTFYLDSVSVLQSDAEQLLHDGGFESGNIGNQLGEYIQQAGNWVVTNSGAYDGNYSLKGAGNWQYTSFRIGVIPGTEYEVSFDAKTSGAFYFQVNNSFWDGGAIMPRVNITGNGTFNTYSNTFTAPDGVYTVWVGLKSASEIYIDNFSVKVAVPEPEPEPIAPDIYSKPLTGENELVENGTFDSVTLGEEWSSDAESMAVENYWASYPGNGNCLKVKTGKVTSSAKLTLEVEAGASYSASFYTTGNLKYSVIGQDGKNISDEVSVSGNQKKSNFSINIPEGINKIQLLFTAKNAEFYVDSVSVIKSSASDSMYDGGFENGIIGRQFGEFVQAQGNWSVVKGNAQNGEYALKSNGSWNYGSFRMGVIPGKTYNLSFAAKTSGAFYYQVNDTFWDGQAVMPKVNVTGSGSYTTYNRTFTVPNGIYTVWVGFKSANAIYIDDISLTPEINVEVIDDVSFHSGKLNNQWSGSAESITVENFWASYPGNSYCLKVITGNKIANAKASVLVKPGATYSVSFYTTGNVKYSVATAAGTMIKEETSVSGNQKKSGFSFKAPSDATRVELIFTAENTTFYVDSVSIIENSCIELLENGNFEEGSIGRQFGEYIDNPGSWSVVSDNAYAGEYALKCNGGWKYASFRVGVVPGRTYNVSFYAKTTGAFYYQVNNTFWDNQAVMPRVNETGNGEYKKYSAQFVAPENTHTVWLGFKSASEIYIDNISVKDVENLTADSGAYKKGELGLNPHTEDVNNLIKNPSFIKGLEGSFADAPEGFAISDDGYNDNKALVVSSKGKKTEYAVKLSLTANTDYTFSFMAKAYEANDFKLAIAKNKDGLNIQDARYIKIAPTGSYSLYGYTFNSDEDTILYLYISCENGSVLLDDMAVFGGQGIDVLPSAPHIYTWKKSNLILNKENSNLIENADFEKGSEFAGGENVNSEFYNGSHSLRFKADGQRKTVYAKIAVEPDNLYYFSTYIKAMSVSRDESFTFGIFNPRTNTYLTIPYNYKSSNDETPDTDENRALTPPNWDNQWHKRGYVINTKGLTEVYIRITGTDAEVYFDDMIFCKMSDTITELGNSPEIGTAISEEKMGCNDKDNLISDSSFQNKKHSEWTNVANYDKFISIKENENGDFVLSTIATEVGRKVYYIRWIKVTPDTQYNFSVMARSAAEDAVVSFGLVDDSKKPSKVFAVNNVTTEWAYYGCTFNSGENTRVGIFVCDTGAIVEFDHFRLFESSKAITLNPEELAAKIKSDAPTEESDDNNSLQFDDTEDDEISDTDVENIIDDEKQDEPVKSDKKVMVKKTLIPGTFGGLSYLTITLIIAGWLVFAIIIWLTVSFFTKTSVFSKRGKGVK